jgi:hypothetical protein
MNRLFCLDIVQQLLSAVPWNLHNLAYRSTDECTRPQTTNSSKLTV